jgi:hypothetical protein
MRVSIIITTAAMFIAAAAIIPTSAKATRKACSANPNCHELPGNDKNPGFCVRVGKDGCGHYVDCYKGNCSKMWIKSGGKQRPFHGNINAFIKGTVTKPAGVKTLRTTTAGAGTPKLLRNNRTQPPLRTNPVVRAQQNHAIPAQNSLHR